MLTGGKRSKSAAKYGYRNQGSKLNVWHVAILHTCLHSYFKFRSSYFIYHIFYLESLWLTHACLLAIEFCSMEQWLPCADAPLLLLERSCSSIFHCWPTTQSEGPAPWSSRRMPTSGPGGGWALERGVRQRLPV